jgi:tRNA G37 N-methylase Trm5
MGLINVDDKYRKNRLSLIPGGSTVTVHRKDGAILVYDKVKMPRRYIAKLKFRDEIERVDINGRQVWDLNTPGKKYWEEKDR